MLPVSEDYGRDSHHDVKSFNNIHECTDVLRLSRRAPAVPISRDRCVQFVEDLGTKFDDMASVTTHRLLRIEAIKWISLGSIQIEKWASHVARSVLQYTSEYCQHSIQNG